MSELVDGNALAHVGGASTDIGGINEGISIAIKLGNESHEGAFRLKLVSGGEVRRVRRACHIRETGPVDGNS
jgi:hypothetical protein